MKVIRKHFSTLKPYEIDKALNRIWRELYELSFELEELNQGSDQLPQLRRVMDGVSSVQLHYGQYRRDKPKSFFEKRDAEADEDVRFIAGAALDLAELVTQVARKEIEGLRSRHASD